MKTHIKILILSSLLLFSICCNRDELPEPTQSGEHTFGCLVNGKEWKARGGIRKNPEVSFGISSNTNLYHISIIASRKSGDGSSIMIRYSYINGIGKYKIWGGVGQRFDTTMHMRYSGGGSGRGICPTVKENPGTLEITYIDTINQIVVGRFEFDGLCDDGSIVKIRDGRFDFEYE